MRHTLLTLAFLVFVTVLPGGAQDPVRVQKICPPCAAVASMQSNLDKIPLDALNERTWALGPRGVNLPWSPGGDIGGRLPGAGATIVQIDTGVTNHPLLASSIVDVHAADGLYGPGHTNLDPLLSGFLRFPGHGTKTSSVIVAKEAPDGMIGVVGAAPGARLIPIRATEGVVLFNRQIGELNADQQRIAHALNEAARGAGSKFIGRQVDVVSMSLGGWPGDPALCQAVENATRAGIIVVVAAGNEVKRTKYPARCPTAIAVGGSTYGGTPWSGSAGSEEVAVSAPAEGVWTAAVVNGVPCMEASSGTSFATALVASMAAEWVARRIAAGMAPARNASTPEAFKQALKESVHPWTGSPADVQQWSRKFGAGIADMTRLR